MKGGRRNEESHKVTLVSFPSQLDDKRGQISLNMAHNCEHVIHFICIDSF